MLGAFEFYTSHFMCVDKNNSSKLIDGGAQRKEMEGDSKRHEMSAGFVQGG